MSASKHAASELCSGPLRGMQARSQASVLVYGDTSVRARGSLLHSLQCPVCKRPQQAGGPVSALTRIAPAARPSPGGLSESVALGT